MTQEPIPASGSDPEGPGGGLVRGAAAGCAAGVDASRVLLLVAGGVYAGVCDEVSAVRLTAGVPGTDRGALARRRGSCRMRGAAAVRRTTASRVAGTVVTAPPTASAIARDCSAPTFALASKP